LEKRIHEVEAKIEILANALKEYQEENNILSLDKQTSALIQSYSSLVSDKLAVDIQNEYLENFYPTNSPMIENIKQKKAILEKKILDFENSMLDGSKYVLSLSSIPELSLNYQDLILRLGIQKKVYEYLYPQYEAAKISEVKDLSTIEIVDVAVNAGQRTKPRRAKICIISFIISIIFFTVLSFIIEKVELIFNDKHKKEKLNEIKRNFSFKS
jgi:capsule polysaccharide export protein KpsE/RkpR